MAGPLDFSQGALYSAMGGGPQGALYGGGSYLNDPTTATLLSMGSALLSAGGPSPQPISFGQALGAGINSGLGTFHSVQQANLLNALRGQQLQKAQLENQLTQSLATGGMGGQMTPDQLEAYGQRLAAAGHPGGAGLIAAAEKLRTQQQNAQTIQSFRSAPGTLGAGVTTTSPQGQALLGNLTGDRDFDQSVLAAQNDALNSNARPTMPAQPVAAPNPGLFGALASSPYVGPTATAMQRMVDTAPARGLSPQHLLTQLTALQNQDRAGQNQQENRDLRLQLAGQADQTRRDLAEASRGSREDNRRYLLDQHVITNEDRLAAEYDRNPTVKAIQSAKPVVTTAANYMAGNKFDSSGDRALAFAYAKILDPNDRVGVNDVKDIGKLGNVPERVIQAVQGLAEGKMLPDRVRQEMFQVIRNKYETLNEQAAQVEDEFTQRATGRMLNPRNVVVPYAVRRNKSGSGGSGGARVVDFNSLPK